MNNAQQTAFNSIDTIDGGAGVDTLSLELAGNYVGGATIKNVEKLGVSFTAGGQFNTTGIAGLTDVAVNAGVATTFQNLGNIVNAQISNTANATTLQFADAAVAGSTDSTTITLDNVTGAAAVNVDSVTPGLAGVETVNLVTANNASSVTLASVDTTISKVTVAGDKNLTLALGNNVATSATTLDASALTGALTVSGFGAANQSVTGGKGNDVFSFGLNFNANDTVNGGDGTDTLAITSAAAQTAISAAQWAKVSNVEAVRFTDGGAGNATDDVAQDMAVLTGVSNVGVVATAAAADNYSFSNVNANTAFTVTGAGQAAASLNIALKDSSGLSDSTTVKLGDATETAAVGVTLSSLTDVAGAETVNIVSLGSSNATTNTLSTTAVAGKLVITGDASFTLGAVTASTQVDASGLKGVFTVGSGTPYAIDGGNIQSGSGNDVITAGAGAQTINGGAGNDTITGGAGADLITGGTGADTFVTGAAGASVAASANTLNGTIANGQTLTFGNGVDVITDFVSGTDKLDVATAATVATSGIGLAANTDLATDTTYTILGTYNAATKVFTVDSTATSSTANVATLLVVGDAGALTFQDTTGYTVLVGVASTAAADFV